jgi:hypothetical protein
MNNAGHLALHMALEGPATNAAGLFWNTLLVIQQGSVVDAPQVPTTTTWVKFGPVKMNESNTLLTVCEINNPDVQGNREKTIARIRVDSSGNLLSTDILASKGLNFGTLQGAVSEIAETEHTIALNDRDDFMGIIKPTTAGYAIVLNEQILAQEGFPSFFENRQWTTLGNESEVDLNDFGEHAYTGAVRGNSGAQSAIFLVVNNGAVLAREGEVIPSLAPGTIGNGVFAPIYICNSGDVYWAAQTNLTTAFMRNREVIIQVGDPLEGTLVNDTNILQNSFFVSEDGRFFVGKIALQGIGTAMVFVDFGLIVPIPGCGGNEATLRLAEGHSIVNGRMKFEMDEGQVPGAVPVLTATLAPAIPGSGCGIMTRWGELLIAPHTTVGRVFGPAWTDEPVVINVTIPNSLSLVDTDYYVQGFFWDTAHQAPGSERFRLTTGLRGQIGAP